MKNIILVSFVLLTCNQHFGQSKFGNEWMTGGGGQRIKFIDTIIKTNNNHFILSYFSQDYSNICDTGGNLILCCDGYNVYGTSARVGTPPCMLNYGLGAKVCFPDAVEEVSDKGNELLVYPNPAATTFYIKNKEGKKKELFNAIGELVNSTHKDEIEVRHFSKGVYYLRCEGMSMKVIIE